MSFVKHLLCTFVEAQHVGSSDVIRWNQPMGGSIPTDDSKSVII